MAGYLIEERRRWPVIIGLPLPHEDNVRNKFRIWKEMHVQMRKPFQSPGRMKNSSYYVYIAPVRVRIHDLPHTVASNFTRARLPEFFIRPENLTKRRSDLLNRTRAQPDIKAAWTTDGRIVCLLENGEKRTIVTERDLDQLHRHQ